LTCLWATPCREFVNTMPTHCHLASLVEERLLERSRLYAHFLTREVLHRGEA